LWNTNLEYFHEDKGRGAKVPKAILGENFKGTVLCDFYASYNFLEKKQGASDESVGKTSKIARMKLN